MGLIDPEVNHEKGRSAAFFLESFGLWQKSLKISRSFGTPFSMFGRVDVQYIERLIHMGIVGLEGVLE
jgi:hypothetical protein